MHPLLVRQVARATRASGEVDLAHLLQLVDAAYAEADRQRERNDRASGLMCEEMDALNDELRRLAHQDPLTKLPNRLAFAEFAQRAVARSKRGECAVLAVDLDRFKAVNDTLGHAIGDALLCEVAARLRSTIREGDDVARMGGDEFAILQISCDLPQSAEALAGRLVRALSAPYVIRGFEISVGASVGIAVARPAADHIDGLLRRADAALYRAKNGGRCAWRMDGQDEHESAPAARHSSAIVAAP